MFIYLYVYCIITYAYDFSINVIMEHVKQVLLFVEAP